MAEYFIRNFYTISGSFLLACFVAYARCPVERDYRNQCVLYQPLPEGPARLTKQFMQIGMGLALVHGKRIIDEDIYNIIRKTGLKQKTNESIPKFVKRIVEDIKDRPEFYFIRLEVITSKQEIMEFRKELLGLLSDFIAWRNGKAPHYKNPNNCITKYGRCEYIGVCSRDEYSSLTKRKVIFKELSDY